MKSLIVRRRIIIAGRRTCVSLEDAFWTGLKEIASRRELALSELVAAIDAERVRGSLSSAIRLFVLDQFRGMIQRRTPIQVDQRNPAELDLQDAI